MSPAIKIEDLYRVLETALDLPANSVTSQNAASMSFTLDSMGAVLLTSFFDSEVGVVVDVERLMNCRRVNDLVQMLDEKKQAL
jgi:acyl carrier protein